MKARARLTLEDAEFLAVQALSFIAEEPGRLGAFLAATGLISEGMREAARDPGFLAGVLDHMLGDEILLIAFADSAGIDPTRVGQARAILGKRWERDVP